MNVCSYDCSIEEKPYFCMAPWVHLYVSPDASVGSCCSLQDNLGHLSKGTLKDIWNSKDNKQMRLSMLDDKPIESCRRCYNEESLGLWSLRNTINSKHKHLFHIVDETEKDGSFRYNNIYVDIRFSNLCNFRCRMCNSQYSSSFFKEAKRAEKHYGRKDTKELGLVGNFSDNKVIRAKDFSKEELWPQIEEVVDNCESIYFAGGEPLLMDEHYKIIKRFINTNRYDVDISYSSNFSKLKYKDLNFLDVWPKFKKLSIAVSLDGKEEVGEYIRYGQNWKRTEQNLEDFRKKVGMQHLWLTPTVSCLSALHLPDMYRHVVDKGWFKPSQLYLIPINHPRAFMPQAIPQKVKEKIKNKYEELGKWLRSIGENLTASRWENMIDYIYSQDLSKIFTNVVRHSIFIDEMRGNKGEFFKTFPEYKFIKDRL